MDLSKSLPATISEGEEQQEGKRPANRKPRQAHRACSGPDVSAIASRGLRIPQKRMWMSEGLQ